ncbi:unnamed protein product [Ceutorhynchus assimilis]|uniref:Uncharacterized protein n=1 Tax=Ceutorhynchus assimilis TaxID=467358 RepID=A0A9N9N298_9CUCU|nr:unnamed protein product [Ceutorhynchus assimilis]
MAAISSHNPSMEVDIAPELQQILTLAKEAVQNETDGLYNDSALLWRQAASILVAYANANIDPDEVGIVTKVKSLIGWLVSRAIENNNVKQLAPNYTNKGVYFFFTTNLLSKIEPAIKRRYYGLFIGYPKTKEAITSLYRHNLANFKNTVSEQTIETLATANDKLLSPSAIASIVKLASTLANKITTNDKFRRVGNHLYIKDPNGSYTFADVSKEEGKPITKHILEIVPINDNNLINAWRATPSAITAEELERYKDEANCKVRFWLRKLYT